MTYCCQTFFITPCCCYEFYDCEKYLKSDLRKMCKSQNVKMLIFTIQTFPDQIDINYPYYNGDTLLHWACENDHKNVVIQIIDLFGNKIDTNIKNKNNCSILQVSNGNISALLLSKFPSIQ